MLVVSIINSLCHGLKGSHGKAWFFFLLAVSSWFVAEMILIVYELVLENDPSPSSADYFYLIGYPFYFVFAMMYLKPVMGRINRKMMVVGSSTGLLLLIPTIFFVFDGKYDATLEELFWALSYPIADSIVLVPATFAVALFFEGKVIFM